MEQKTMATKSSDVNPTIQVARDTDTPVVPGDFHNFQGSQSKQYVTFDNRADKIAAALGGKAPLKS